MTIEENDITTAMLLAYRDQALDSDGMKKVRDELAVDSKLHDIYQALLAQEDSLYDLGVTLRDVMPSLDIQNEVMGRLQHLAVEAEPFAQVLLDMGRELRAAVPALDIADDVMKSIVGLRQEVSATQLEEELIETGKEIQRLVPRIDIAEDVVNEVTVGQPANVTSFPAAKHTRLIRRRSSVSWSFFAAAAACVLAILAFIVMQMVQPLALRGLDVAEQDPSVTGERRSDPSTPYHEGESLLFTPVSTDQRIPLSVGSVTEPPVKEDEPQEDLRSAVDIKNVIAARREALEGKGDSLARLAHWGALDLDEVRRLLAEKAISLKELAGISRFLPEEEARLLLENAVAQHPNDPLLRYALAKNLMNDTARYDDASRQLASFQELAPDNSLSYYMDAQLRLAEGDYAGALQIMEYASAFQSGSAYALESAQHHSAVLQAAGVSGDVAQMLSAFDAGANEYGVVTQLGEELLGYGAYYESIGDYDTALAIYKGVNQLGLQINQGS
ncbi:MAG: hypothetical protein KAH38_12050, partial [Candidatus Hydrogenedentes bacterium]|nr:hypothetical protein [Candidatus Hydrogenedentota bacterium]